MFYYAGKHEEQDSGVSWMLFIKWLIAIFLCLMKKGHEGEASLEGLIKFGTLALQLLPRNALKGGHSQSKYDIMLCLL